MLCGQARSDKCFGTLTSATTLLLRGQARSDQCFGTPASATTLLLHGQASSDQCFSSPASTMTLLLRGQARFDQCFSILCLVLWYSLISATTLSVSASALLLYATTPQYYIIPSSTYCDVSYSFLITGLGNPAVI